MLLFSRIWSITYVNSKAHFAKEFLFFDDIFFVSGKSILLVDSNNVNLFSNPQNSFSKYALVIIRFIFNVDEVFTRQLFLQKARSWIFERVLNTSLSRFIEIY